MFAIPAPFLKLCRLLLMTAWKQHRQLAVLVAAMERFGVQPAFV
jgi:hypothetical protein